MSAGEDQDRIASLREHARRIASHGGGDGGEINERVTRLETHMEYVRRDLDELKTGQANVLAKLDGLALRQGDLPTRRDLQANLTNIVVIGLAMLAITISGAVGGLAVINHYAAAGPASSGTSTPPSSASAQSSGAPSSQSARAGTENTTH